ncbi:MAG TPA: hypothetical protein VEV81_11600, partial [Pyrinomonadaceae bacterium]|nr:hypothetical protein [Pyrinomonadaceae bacterium]
ATSLRWSGLASRVEMPNLTSLATDRAREYVTNRFTPFGIASRLRSSMRSASSATSYTRPRVSRPSVNDIDERLLDRIDPASQLDKLARFFWHRDRLAALRGRWMYFYTDLRGVGNGLAGVNIHTGQTDVRLRLSDPDERFITDETTGLLYTSKGNRLMAYRIGGSGG